MKDPNVSLLSPSLPPLPQTPFSPLHHNRVVLIQFPDNVLKVRNITFLLPDTRTGLSTRVKPISEGQLESPNYST